MPHPNCRKYTHLAKTFAVSVFTLTAFCGKSIAAEPLISVDYSILGSPELGAISGPGDFAGVAGEGVRVAYWNDFAISPDANVFNGLMTSTSLLDSTGRGTGISVTLQAAGVGTNSAGFDSTDALMMRSIVGGNTVTSTFNHLEAASTGTTYDLFAYYQGLDSSDTVLVDVSVASAGATQHKYGIDFVYGTDHTSYIEGDQTDPNATSFHIANYSKFQNLTANGTGQIVLNLQTDIDSPAVGLSGVQLVTHTPTWTGYLSNIWGNGGLQNWTQNATATGYKDGWYARFDDTALNYTLYPSASGVTPARVTVDNSAHDYTFASGGVINGPTDLIKTGTGALNIVGDNHTFTGDIYIKNGSINVNALGGAAGYGEEESIGLVQVHTGALGMGVNIHFGETGASGQPGTTGVLNYTAEANFENVSRVILSDAGASGVINIPRFSVLGLRNWDIDGDMEKGGPGTLLFREGSTGTGTWNVTQGTLDTESAGPDDRSSIGTNFVVHAGATLKSSDAVGGPCTMQIMAGGTLSAVPGVGYVSVDFFDQATLQLDSGARLKFDLNDFFEDSGSLKFDDASAHFNFSGALTLELNSSLGFSDPTGQSFLLIDGFVGGDSVDLTHSNVTLDLANAGWYGGVLSYDAANNDLYISGLTNVPEPSTTMTLLGGTAALLGFHRFGRQRKAADRRQEMI